MSPCLRNALLPSLVALMLPGLAGCACFGPAGGAERIDRWSRGEARPVQDDPALGPARQAVLDTIEMMAISYPDAEDALYVYETLNEIYAEAGDQEALTSIGEDALQVLMELGDDEDEALDIFETFSPALWGAGLCEEVILYAEESDVFADPYEAVAAEICAHDGELATALEQLAEVDDEGTRADAILGILVAIEDTPAKDLPEGFLDRLVVRTRTIESRDDRRRVLVGLVSAYAAAADTKMMERLVSRARMGIAELGPRSRLETLAQLAAAYKLAKKDKEAVLLLHEAIEAGAEGLDLPALAFGRLVTLSIDLGKIDGLVAATKTWTDEDQQIGFLVGLANTLKARGKAKEARAAYDRVLAVAQATEDEQIQFGRLYNAALLAAALDLGGELGTLRKRLNGLADANAELDPVHQRRFRLAIASRDASAARKLIASTETDSAKDGRRLALASMLADTGDLKGAAAAAEEIQAYAQRAVGLTQVASAQAEKRPREAARRFLEAYDYARAGLDGMWGSDTLFDIAAWHARSGRTDVAVEVLLDVADPYDRVDMLIDLVSEIGPTDEVTPRLELMLTAHEARAEADAEIILMIEENAYEEQDCDSYCEEYCPYDDYDDDHYYMCEEDYDLCFDDCDLMFDECYDDCPEDDDDCIDACDDEASDCEIVCEDEFDECTGDDWGMSLPQSDQDHPRRVVRVRNAQRRAARIAREHRSARVARVRAAVRAATLPGDDAGHRAAAAAVVPAVAPGAPAAGPGVAAGGGGGAPDPAPAPAAAR